MADPSKGAKRDRLQDVGDLVAERLEAGRADGWKKPWLSLEGARNGLSGGPYQGIIALILGTDPRVICSGDPRFFTFGQILALEKARQAKDPDAPRISLRKGSKGQHVLAWKPMQLREASLRDTDGEQGSTSVMRLVDAHVVFHASEIDGLPGFERKAGKGWDAHSEAEAILSASGITIRHQGDRAFISSRMGEITLPARDTFKNREDYYGTAFHELSHARFEPVMQKSRGAVRFGSEAYAQEEVRVELAAAMVCDGLGLVRDGHRQAAAYIGNWLQAVREDKYEVFRAATDAKRIAIDILSLSPNEEVRALAGERPGQEVAAGVGQGGSPPGPSAAPQSTPPDVRSSKPGWQPDVYLTEHQEAEPTQDGTRRWISIGRDRAGAVTLIETDGYGGPDMAVLAKAPHDDAERWRLNSTPYRDKAGDVVGWRVGKVVTLDQGIDAMPAWARAGARRVTKPTSRLAAAIAKAAPQPSPVWLPSAPTRSASTSPFAGPL